VYGARVKAIDKSGRAGARPDRAERGERGERGLRSEALKDALTAAIAGRPDDLETLLARHGGMPAPRPNLELAAAFGSELASVRGEILPLLERLSRVDAAPDTAEIFLPIAAAHAWVALIRTRREVEAAWAALPPVLADERAPVRLGIRDALVQLLGQPGQSDRLVERAQGWLADIADRDERFGVAALVAEVLADKTVLANLVDDAALRAYLSGVLEDASAAPRTASRMDSYRRVLAALPRALAAAVARGSSLTGGRVGDTAEAWLAGACAVATHPPVRDALSEAIAQLRLPTHGQSAGVVTALRLALEKSAKPPRDPTLIRPGLGRGKRSRPIR
jgi:hypothetical protein